MLISKNKPPKKKKSNKASQEFLKQSEKALFTWQQTALNNPFSKFQIASKKLDELKQSSICLNFLFSPECTLPVYSDVEEFFSFHQTRHPKHLSELVKREYRQLDNFLTNLDNFTSLKYPALLFVLPDSLKHRIREKNEKFPSSRFDHLIKWWEGLQLYVNRYDIPIRFVRKGEVERFREEVKQLTIRIKNVKKGVITIRRGRRKKDLVYIAATNRQWEMFRDKGMKALKARYRGHYEDRCNKRLVDLKKFLNAVSADFPHQIYEDTLDKLNHHFYKREPLLKAIYGYLIGIVTDSKRKIKPNSMVKEVDRLIKSKNHELGQ